MGDKWLSTKQGVIRMFWWLYGDLIKILAAIGVIAFIIYMMGNNFNWTAFFISFAATSIGMR